MMAVALPVAAYRDCVDGATCATLAEDCVVLSRRRRGRSFYVALDATAGCLLEGLAQRIARSHAAALGFETLVGVECQVREVGAADASILLHRDKDEVLWDRARILRHPQLSTVTYLRADRHSAPLVVFGDGFASLAVPAVGKHVAFRGDLLHGAPAECGARLFDQDAPSGTPPLRVSLLANLWQDRPPCGVDRFEEAGLLSFAPLEAEITFDLAHVARAVIERAAATSHGGVLLSDADPTEAPPLPLAQRHDRRRARAHARAATEGLLAFLFDGP